jgi:hypothetical protein
MMEDNKNNFDVSIKPSKGLKDTKRHPKDTQRTPSNIVLRNCFNIVFYIYIG